MRLDNPEGIVCHQSGGTKSTRFPADLNVIRESIRLSVAALNTFVGKLDIAFKASSSYKAA